jgi:MAPEG family
MLISRPEARGSARFPPVVKLGMLAAFVLSLGLWLAVYFAGPPIPGMVDVAARLAFAIKCACLAVLLCLLSGIEAVSHERLQTDAFDPLAGRESRRLKINQRYLQNTLEQMLLFVPGLLGLAIYCDDGRAMHAVLATTIVWITSRAVFWIGYHQASLYRVFGLVGLPQSMLVLLYVCARFGHDLAGAIGAIVPLVIFAAIEIVLVKTTRPQPGTSDADG